MFGRSLVTAIPAIAAAAALATILSGCGRHADSDGMLAELNGEVIKLSQEEAKTLCGGETFCEPNFIYSIDMARPRPAPAPEPAPTMEPERKKPTKPTPTPTKTVVAPLPDKIKDSVDYSRALLNLTEAWKITQGSREVIVAVIDTGVDYTHPDLKNNIWVNDKEQKGKAGVDDDGNGYIDDVYGYDFRNNRPNGMDDHKHGTHVAGTIGAELNGKGVVGVAPKVRIMPLKFLGADGSGEAQGAIRAIDYAVAKGAHIISNSWGGGGRSDLIEKAIARATAKGILVVAAAGNEANNNDISPRFPAGYPGVISVASTDSKDLLSYFSNFGKKAVTIAAPGSEILSTVPGGGYGTLSGTSMATPQVSGALALALSLGKTSSATVQSLLCSSSRKILLSQTQCGRMDVAAFVKAVSQR